MILFRFWDGFRVLLMDLRRILEWISEELSVNIPDVFHTYSIHIQPRHIPSRCHTTAAEGAKLSTIDNASMADHLEATTLKVCQSKFGPFR